MHERTGYAIANRLGLRATGHSGGWEGLVYFLDDGRVMKVTNSEVEAAVALAIMAEQQAGHAHPSVPRIDHVTWFTTYERFHHSERGEEGMTMFVVVRESFDDLFAPAEDGDYEDASHALEWALLELDKGWDEGCSVYLSKARETWRRHSPGTELEEVLQGVMWVHERTGAQLLDIKLANVGYGATGTVGMRDLGRARVPDHLMHPVTALAFAPLHGNEDTLASVS